MDKGSCGVEKIVKNKKLIIPEFVAVKNSSRKLVQKSVQDLSKDDSILDVGNRSAELLAPVIKKSKLILWNGPLGKYEAGGGGASKKVLKMVAASKAASIIGGGDIVSIVSEMKMEKKLSFVSTGGGATLDFLANGTLPGIKALG